MIIDFSDEERNRKEYRELEVSQPQPPFEFAPSGSPYSSYIAPMSAPDIYIKRLL